MPAKWAEATREGGKVGTFLGSTVPSFLRRIAGMPDYAVYTEHFRRCHPGSPLLSEREFYQEFVKSRYADGPTRCC